jgi:hypothetical protein
MHIDNLVNKAHQTNGYFCNIKTGIGGELGLVN